MDRFQKSALEQIASIESKYAEIKTHVDQQKSWPDNLCTEFNVACLAAIERIAGAGSSYDRHANIVVSHWNGGIASPTPTNLLYPIIRALKADVANGYLRNVSELIHADLFADYLEMADHLVDEGYKDAAAVIAGSTLESHLRQLCVKNGVSLTETASNGDERPRKADRLNQELAKASVYNQLRAKQVVSWLDLRNKAAHGHYDQYTDDQVKLFIDGIRDFMVSLPA